MTWFGHNALRIVIDVPATNEDADRSGGEGDTCDLRHLFKLRALLPTQRIVSLPAVRPG
jgi:hypothetical protein